MFTHKVLINTTHSMHLLKLDLANSNMRIYDFSDESFVFYEELFWTNTFLRPMVKCSTEKENIVRLSFYLRKFDKILVLLYLVLGSIISLLPMVSGEAEELPLVIILWLVISSLLFRTCFKHNCKRITKKFVSLLK